MGKFLQFFFFVTSIGVTLPSEDPIKKYLEYQTKVWCRSNPFGLLFTKGQHVECSDKGFMPSEDFGKEILNNVTLNVGTLEVGMRWNRWKSLAKQFKQFFSIKIISDRDYDCGVKLREGKWTTKNDYTNYIVKLLQDVLRFE